MKTLISIFVLCLLNFGLYAQTADTLTEKPNVDTLLANCVFEVSGEDFEKVTVYNKIIVDNDSVHVMPSFDKKTSYNLKNIISKEDSDVGLVYQMGTSQEAVEILLIYDESGLFGLAVVNLKTLKEQHYFFDKNL